MTMADIDAELVTALKQAKGKKMFFAFIPKGAEGKLIVSKKKIPPKEIAEAKKEIGGGNPITGKCFGPLADMVFTVAKEPSPTVGAALKKVAKRETGLVVVPSFQLASDADAEEEESGAESEQSATAAPAAEAPDEAPAEVDFGPWQAARQTAITDLRALAAKVAATKHGTAAGVIKEIQSIISKLPSNPKPNEIDKVEDFVRNDDTITAAEEVPGHFHNVSIREPLLKALEALRQ
jgi:hypothetical protein